MTDEPKTAVASSLAGGPDKVRDAAKWVVAGFAAIGAALAAGSQLSSLGKLEDPTRLAVAAVAVIVGLLAVAVAMWKTVQLILPGQITLAELASDEESLSAHPRSSAAKVIQFLHANEALFQGRGADVRTLASDYVESAKARAVALEQNYRTPSDETKLAAAAANARAELVGQAVTSVITAASYEHMRQKVAGWRDSLFVASGVAATALVLFAWAANPGEEAGASVDLRGANLTSANLTGADLQAADLTGADLTGAILTGARLKDAKLDGVRWSGTVCPDGVNSNQAGGTCVGHIP